MSKFTSGSVFKSLLALAGPIVLTNLFHTAYQLIDSFWVGRLGATAVAAVSLSFPVIFILITLGGGFSIAGTILVAQNFGAKKLEEVNNISGQTVSLMALISVPISLLGFFLAEPIMRLMGADSAVLPEATSYLKVSSLGIIFMFSFFVFQSLMRGVGEVRKPLYIVAFTVFLNAILDPLFIFGYGSFEGFGVTGAAVATILTQGIASFIGLYILFKGKNVIKIGFKDFKLNLELVKKMFFIGLPASIEQSMKSFGFAIMSLLVASFGTVVLAAYGIGVRMLSFVIIPAFGLSMATSTLVGQNIGAGQPERAREIAAKSAQIGAGLLVIISAIFFLAAETLASTFIKNEPAVVEYATTLIRFMSFAFPLIGVNLVLNGSYQGAGNTKVTMLFSIIALWVFEFPLSYILSKHTGLNETGLWLAVPLANLCSFVVTIAYFNLSKWNQKKLISGDQKLSDEVTKETMIEEGR